MNSRTFLILNVFLAAQIQFSIADELPISQGILYTGTYNVSSDCLIQKSWIGRYYTTNANSNVTIQSNAEGEHEFRMENDGTSFGSAFMVNSGSSLTIKDFATLSLQSGNEVTAGLIYNLGSMVIRNNDTVEIKNGNAGMGGAIRQAGTVFQFDFNGNVLFENNNAIGTVDGGGWEGAISISAGDFLITNTANTVEFNSNSSYRNGGGAICMGGNGSILFDNNGAVTFGYNYVETNGDGGAINLSGTGNTVISNTIGKVCFNANKVMNGSGGAIYDNQSSDLSFLDNGQVVFQDNMAGGATSQGGAIHVRQGSLKFERNGFLEFSGNEASSGGSVFSLGDVSFTNNGDIFVTGNTAHQTSGGAFNLENAGLVMLQNENANIFFQNANILFQDNRAQTRGGAVYVQYGELEISGYKNILFNTNKVEGELGKGGAVNVTGWINGSLVSFNKNKESIIFSGNEAVYSGGAIYVEYESLEFKNNGDISFEVNKVTGLKTDISNTTWDGGRGGAIYITDYLLDSHLEISDNAAVAFIGNESTYSGGAVYADYCGLIISGNDTLVFKNNRVTGEADVLDEFFDYMQGGAIFIYDANLSISNHRGKIEFSGNKAYGSGGAIAVGIGSTGEVNLINNKDILFQGNQSELGHGGGMALYDAQSLIIADNEGDVMFDSNTAYLNGGGIFTQNTAISIEGNKKVSFTNNETLGEGGNGGAIALFLTPQHRSEAVEKTLYIGRNEGNVTFLGNVAAMAGGGIYSFISIKIEAGVYDVLFENNSASSGGGVSLYQYTESPETNVPIQFHLTNSNKVLFLNNSATHGHGGAIHMGGEGNIEFFDIGTVALMGNTAGGRGGAILGDKVVFLNNGYLFVSENGAVGNSGAFDMKSLLIANCGSVIFEKNYLNNNEYYTLRSIYQSDASQGIVLVTEHGQSKDSAGIVFYDSIYAEGDLTMNQWVNASGVTETTHGFILFSGKNTSSDLEAIKHGQATEDEITSSRSSIVAGNVLFLGGQLIVEEGMGIMAGGTFVMADKTLLEMTRNGNIGGHTVTMEEKTVLRVGIGATIYSEQMDLGRGITFDLHPFLDTRDCGVTVYADNWNLGGTIHLYDNLDYYEDSRWATRQVYNLIYDQNHTRDQKDFQAIVTDATGENTVLSPYTYQGYWTYNWEGDQLVAIWNVTGPIQDIKPEQEGNIVSNALYTSSQNLQSLARTTSLYMDIARLKASVKNNYWVKGIGDFSMSRNAHDLDGFKYSAGGYSAGADCNIGKSSIAGIAIGQMFGKVRSRLYSSSIEQDSMMGALYTASLQTVNESNGILWTGLASYGNISNKMQTHYGNDGMSAAKWHNSAFYMETKGLWRHDFNRCYTLLSGVGLEYSLAEGGSFKESGDKNRDFGKGKYENLALPLAMGVETHSCINAQPLVHTFLFSYVPDVYRNNPVTPATKILSNYSWDAQGSRINRNAFRLDYGSTLSINSNWKSYASYRFEVRDNLTSQNVYLGASYSY